MSGILLLGLGPGNPAQLTREAWEVLSSAAEIWVRTAQHPTLHSLPATVKVHSFDHLYEDGEDFGSVYSAIVEKVLELGGRKEGVIYAVPGDPFVAEATAPEIARQAQARSLPVRIVSGLSFLEPVFAALGLDPYPRLVLMDALELGDAHVPSFPPDMPVMVAQMYSRLVASEVKMTLNAIYPDEHPVRLIHAAGTHEQIIEDIPLYELDRSEHIGLLTALYLPPLGEGTSLEAFQEIVAHLRAPDGCPWDREQTHQTLRTHLLEEAYEALAALDSGDPEKMAEEFGDLLLQIVLNAQIGTEEGEFGMADILKGIYDKIIRRHPHVFGDVSVNGIGDVTKNWDKIKGMEREQNGTADKSILDSVPQELPALSQAQECQNRVARVGFDWQDITGVINKISEEIQEVNISKNYDELSNEIGDLLFSVVNFCRWKKVDAESALRKSINRFRLRFNYVEKNAKSREKKVSSLSAEELEGLWREAKKNLG